VLGEASAHETFTGRGTHWMGSKTPRTGVQDDQAENRVKDMEDEGADAHFMVPTLWVSVVGLPDVELEVGLIRAYHRHAEEFCGQFPMRLKTAIVASTRHVDEAVREITRWGSSKWAAAVLPVFGKDIPVDHPDLEPIWTVAQESADCAPQQHVESTVLPRLPGSMGQHLPGPARVAPLGRDAVHGRLHRGRDPGSLPAAAHGGPRMRLRLAPLLGKAHERAGGLRGRRGAPQACALFNYVTSVFGDDVLMYASDYPHSECQFPDSVDDILKWSSLKPDTRRKLLWDNAARFYRQT
jgi:hypothetical protein